MLKLELHEWVPSSTDAFTARQIQYNVKGRTERRRNREETEIKVKLVVGKFSK